jgi:hypothetical protein
MIGPNNLSAGEKVAKIPPTDNVYQRYSRIIRIKKKILIIKTKKQPNNLKTSRGPCRDRDVPNNAIKFPKISLDCPFNTYYTSAFHNTSYSALFFDY